VIGIASSEIYDEISKLRNYNLRADCKELLFIPEIKVHGHSNLYKLEANPLDSLIERHKNSKKIYTKGVRV